MPLAEKDIAKYRQEAQTKKSHDERLQYIAKLDPKKTVPVILKILEQIVAADTNLDVDTREYLQYCKTILLDTDEKQNVGVFGLASALKGITAEKIQNDLGRLVADTKKITITPKTESLWVEAQLWLAGWFKHTFDPALKEKATNQKCEILRNKDGKLITIDTEDWAFNKATDLSKFYVAHFYYQLAEKIREIIQGYRASLQPKSSSPIFVSTSVMTKANDNGYITLSINLKSADQERISAMQKVMSAIADAQQAEKVTQLMQLADPEDDVSETIANAFAVLCGLANAKDKKLQSEFVNLIELIKTKEKLLPQPERVAPVVEEPSSSSSMSTAVQPVISEQTVESMKQNKKSLREHLEKYQDESDEVRFGQLNYGIEHCALTQTELDYIKSTIIPNLDADIASYKSAWFTTHWVPTIFVARKHTSIANDTLHRLSVNDACDGLKSLYTLWLHAKKENSHELLDIVTKCLSYAYTMLVKFGEPSVSHALK